MQELSAQVTYEQMMGIVFWTNLLSRFSLMVIIGTVLPILAVLLERKDKRKRPRGLILLYSLLILGSIYKLMGFWEYDYYRFMFQQLPEQAIFARYCLSLFMRLAAIIIAVGVLMLLDVFRKALLWFSSLNLCTLYWKHPFFVFDNIARQTEQLFLHQPTFAPLEHPEYPWISMAFYYALDIIFSLSILYYFTRPKIKEQFR